MAKSKTVTVRGREYWRAASEFVPRRKWISVPVPPTKEMLQGMAEATFMDNGSLLEMERRFNGMLEHIPVKRK